MCITGVKLSEIVDESYSFISNNEFPFYRIYYKKNEAYDNLEKTGFIFSVTKWSGSMCNSLGLDLYDDPDSTYINIIRGTACFDGIRHLAGILDEDSDPYINYPDMLAFVWMFTELRYLEVQFCSEYSK